MTARSFLILGGFVPLIPGVAMVAEENSYRSACLGIVGQLATALSPTAASECQSAESTWGWGITLIVVSVALLLSGVILSILRPTPDNNG